MPLDTAFDRAARRPAPLRRAGAGARATLAVRGGFDVPAVLGSRATQPRQPHGSVRRPRLRAGDVCRSAPRRRVTARRPAEPAAAARSAAPAFGSSRAARRACSSGCCARQLLYATRFIVTPQSNRMGYRLEGPRLVHAGSADILSDATPIGSMQVPASGHPILLMADRQTTGGYPKIATVISADLPLAGQLAPGDWIEFAAVSRAEARRRA